MVDLSSGQARRAPTADYVERFCGGRGIAARLYWEMADPGFYATKLVDDYGMDSKVIDRTIGWMPACHQAGILTDESTGRCFTHPLRFDQVNPGCVVPGRDWQPVSRKGATLDRGPFERMRDEYYPLRGWGVESGCPTPGPARGPWPQRSGRRPGGPPPPRLDERCGARRGRFASP